MRARVLRSLPVGASLLSLETRRSSLLFPLYMVFSTLLGFLRIEGTCPNLNPEAGGSDE